MQYGARIDFSGDVLIVIQTKSIGGDRYVLDLTGKTTKYVSVPPGPNQAKQLLIAVQRARAGELVSQPKPMGKPTVVALLAPGGRQFQTSQGVSK